MHIPLGKLQTICKSYSLGKVDVTALREVRLKPGLQAKPISELRPSKHPLTRSVFLRHTRTADSTLGRRIAPSGPWRQPRELKIRERL
jgi:hypothetical protein